MPQAPREMLTEDLVTPPSEWCPHPERWHSTDDESCEVEVAEFVAALVRLVQPNFALETGTAFGQTTVRMAEALERNGHGQLYSLDFGGDRVEAARARLSALGLGRWANVVLGSSFDWEPPAGVRFQLAFIDCDFGQRHTVFRHFLPHFDRGAIVAFHDVSPGFTDGPHGWGAGMPLLNPLVDERLMRLITFRTPRGLAVGEVL